MNQKNWTNKQNNIIMKHMESKTAVRWLFDQLWETPKDKLNWYALLSEAEKMESTQMDAEYKKGFCDVEKSLSKEIEKIREYYRSHRTT